MAKKNIADMSADELAAELASAKEQFDALVDAGIVGDKIKEAAELSARATEIRARQTELKAETEERDATIAQLASAFDDDSAAEGDAKDESIPDAPQAKEPEAQAAGSKDAQVYDITDLIDKLGDKLADAIKPQAPEVVEAVEPDPNALVASSAANGVHTPPPPAPRLSGLAVIVASAESKDGSVVRNAQTDMSGLAKVTENVFALIAGSVSDDARDFAAERMEQFAADYAKDGPAALTRWNDENPLPTFDGLANIAKLPVGHIAKPEVPEIVIDVDAVPTEHNDNAIRTAIERSKLARNPVSLAAAGGWCAPSEVMYDLTEPETTDGIYRIGEVVVRRGGINRTLGPDYSSAFSSVGFAQTEAQAISGTTKATVQVACPSFTDTRMGVRGVNIVAPLLTQAAWPELVARFQRGALTYFAHSTNAAVLSAIETALGTTVAGPHPAPTLSVGGLGAATQNVLDMVEFLVNQQRSKYRLSFNQALELVAPMWLKAVIRADLAARNGVDYLGISDAQIESYFRVRGVNPSFVYDWQDVDQTTGADGYPDTVKLMIFPAGTFVRLTSNVINISAVYDQAMLSVNMYTALFLEEGFAVMRAGYGGVLTTIPIPVTGMTAANSVTTPFNQSQV